MKVMAGYDTRSKTDYRAKAAEEVSKIQAKARLLEERLASFGAVDSDVLEDLAAALQSAQPKIQKMCEEESDDHEAVARLLEINDSIHRTAERYRLLKKGDVEGAAKLAQGAPLPEAGSSGGSAAKGELSLIDFDADAEAGSAGPAAPSGPSQPAQPGGLENDLLGLSIGDPVPTSYGQAGDIALGFGANQSRFSRVSRLGAHLMLSGSQTFPALPYFPLSRRTATRRPRRPASPHSPHLPQPARRRRSPPSRPSLHHRLNNRTSPPRIPSPA